MRAGRLDRLVTIQSRATSLSETGAEIVAWSTIAAARRPASMAPQKGDERTSDPQISATQLIEFRVRYAQAIAQLTPLDRVIYPALTAAEESDDNFVPETRRIYDVQDVNEIGRRDGLVILTKRKSDVTP